MDYDNLQDNSQDNLKSNNGIKKTKECIPKQCIPKQFKLQVWEKHIGANFFAKCLCCKETNINPFIFECGHIIAESKGGKLCVDNIIPICSLCNSSMRTQNLREYQKKLLNFKSKSKAKA